MLFCSEVWEKGQMVLWVCLSVERFFCLYSSCVEQVPSLFYPKQMLPLPADTRSPSLWCHGASSQSEWVEILSSAWQLCCNERRGKILSPRLVVLLLNFLCWVFSMFFLSVGWVQWHWPVFEEHQIDAKAIFLDTKTLSSICIQRALLNRWCPELMSLNSFWSCWNFEKL